jgi:hypothetical protein
METGELRLNESLEKEIEAARDVVEGILKSKKMMRMYPANNPMHINASKGIFEKFNNFFELQSRITLTVTMNSLMYKNEQVYHKQEKDDNLAFFFFKDGLREISFLKDLEQQELEEFINILNIDFESDAPDDDIVTLLWDGDFKKIKYFVDQDFLGNWEVTNDSEISNEKVKSAYKDAFNKETEKKVIQVELNESDFRYLADEMQKQDQPKLQKIITIMFEALYQTEESGYVKEIISIIADIMDYCAQESDFKNAAYVMNTIKGIIEEGTLGDEGVKSFQLVFNKINSKSFIEKMGVPVEESSGVDGELFLSLIRHMDERSIPHFIYLLGQMESIKGRHLVIDALVILGQHNLKKLAKGLSDSQWHVVRNVALVLGKIADPDSVGYLAEILSHADHRVRKEGVIAIGNIKTSKMTQYLKNTINDDDKSVRITTARTLSNLKTGDAKELLLSELSAKSFSVKDLNEKKEFYRIITNWQDQEVKDFLIKTLNKKKFFGKTKNDENRACAAYALGIIKDTDAIKPLESASRSRNRVLRELSTAALMRLNK